MVYASGPEPIRGWRFPQRLTNRSAFLIFLIGLGLVMILSGGWPPAIPASGRLEIVTDKGEYRLGETINTTFYIANYLPFPVRVPIYTRVGIGGYSEGETHVEGCDAFVDWGSTTIYLPARSKHCIHKFSFKPTLEGKFIIEVEIEGPNIKGSKSLTVMVHP